MLFIGSLRGSLRKVEYGVFYSLRAMLLWKQGFLVPELVVEQICRSFSSALFQFVPKNLAYLPDRGIFIQGGAG